MTELPNRLLRDALEDTASKAQSSACLDAAALAAWADGTTSDVERAAVEAHASGCARCLALLAAMTRTEPPRAERPWWRAPLAWLLPLASAAAVVIVVRLAVTEQQSPAAHPAATVVPALPPQVNEPQAAAAPPETSASAPSMRRVAPMKPKRAPVAPAAASPAPALADAAAKDAAAPRAAAEAPSPSTPAASAAPVPLPAPPPAQMLGTAAAGGGGGGRGGVRGFAAQSVMKTAGAAGSIVILSPDPDSRWRIVGGTVEHTADGAATWQPQSIGVATPIRTGAAPAPRVCWLAGAAGVVLRTIDGVTWTRIPFPEPVDLIAIQASDASHVAVTTADGRRFTTSDGGGTWSQQ